MSFDDFNRLTSITRTKVIPAVVHQLKKEMPFFGRMLSKGVKKTVGGTQIVQPVTYKYNVNGGSYSGLEVLNTDLQDTRTAAKYDWKQVYAPIVVENMEIFKNGGKKGGIETIVNMLAQDMEEAKETIKNNMATMAFADGTGNSSKDILGLKGLIDDGSDVTAIGEITLGSYDWFTSSVETSVGSLTLAHMASQYSAASSGNGRESINLIVTTETIFNAYEALNQPNIRWVNPGQGKAIDPGMTRLAYRGAEVIADEYCQSGAMYFINTNYLELFCGDHPDFPTDKNGFTVTDMARPHDQDGKVGFILFYGQMFTKRPARMAKSQGLTA